MELTKDTYEYLLNFTDDSTLLNMLSVNKKFAQKLEDENFFEQLLQKRYPYLLEFKKQNESFKNFYLRKIYYISKIKEKYDIPYYQLKGYDPENKFKSIKKYDIVEPKKFLKETIFVIASKNGNLDFVKNITKDGKISQFYLEAGLLESADFGHLEIVKFLITQGIGANVINNALLHAAYHGKLNIVKYLVEKYRPLVQQALVFARHKHHQDVVNYLEKFQ